MLIICFPYPKKASQTPKRSASLNYCKTRVNVEPRQEVGQVTVIAGRQMAGCGQSRASPFVWREKSRRGGWGRGRHAHGKAILGLDYLDEGYVHQGVLGDKRFARDTAIDVK